MGRNLLLISGGQGKPKSPRRPTARTRIDERTFANRRGGGGCAKPGYQALWGPAVVCATEFARSGSKDYDVATDAPAGKEVQRLFPGSDRGWAVGMEALRDSKFSGPLQKREPRLARSSPGRHLSPFLTVSYCRRLPRPPRTRRGPSPPPARTPSARGLHLTSPCFF